MSGPCVKGSVRVPGFTLLETLLVLALIAMLSALLFPTLLKVRRVAHKPVCSSNLRQLGIAIGLYAQDWDERYPLGSDSPERYLYIGLGDKQPGDIERLSTMPLLRDLLHPYAPNHELWRCPSDHGSLFRPPMKDLNGEVVEVDLNPSAYERLGTSYLYRMRLGLKNTRYGSGCVMGDPPEPRVYGAEGSAVLVDAAADWHNPDRDLQAKKMNVLFADGHVNMVNDLAFLIAWLCDPQ